MQQTGTFDETVFSDQGTITGKSDNALGVFDAAAHLNLFKVEISSIFRRVCISSMGSG
jgi:hypothetical protein